MIYVLVALKSELPNIEDLDSSKIKVWYTGVGKINATVTATLAANQKDCERMINFGTAGTLEPLLAGKILEVGAVRQRDMDTRPHASLDITFLRLDITKKELAKINSELKRPPETDIDKYFEKMNRESNKSYFNLRKIKHPSIMAFPFRELTKEEFEVIKFHILREYPYPSITYGKGCEI